MTLDQDDPILDACLAEVLGGKTPPDLSARILHALEAARLASSAGKVGAVSNGSVLPSAGWSVEIGRAHV